MVCFLMLSIFAGWGEGTSRDEVIEVNTKIMKRVRSQRRWAQQERRWQRQELKHHMKVKVTQSCPTLWDPRDPWNSLGQNTGVGRLSLLQGIFPTQGSNPGLPHCRWIIYQLSHKGSHKNNNSALPIYLYLSHSVLHILFTFNVIFKISSSSVYPNVKCNSWYILTVE